MLNKKILRKVQLEELKILKDIKKVCDENSIQFFLDSGTLIGAIRHKGFIPWDDDLDIGMLREDYDKFCNIAQSELGEKYFWQTWDTDEEYPIPFGKVRKRGTLYVERKAKELKENGFYIDVLPYDFAPESEKKRNWIRKKQTFLFRCLLMKNGFTPWIENGKIYWRKRIGYILYQVIALLFPREKMIHEYMKCTLSVEKSEYVYEQTGKKYYKIEWMNDTISMEFEGELFPVISHYHEWLTTAYGDYMTPPPEDQRENRHQIYKLDFGDASKI